MSNKNILGNILDFTPTHVELGCGLDAGRTKKNIRERKIQTAVGVDIDLTGANIQTVNLGIRSNINNLDAFKRLHALEVQEFLE